MLRSMLLRAEPVVFRALRPLLGGSKARYQRSLLAQKYLSGQGAEIGAGVQPILVPAGSKTYIDRVPSEYWKSQAHWANEWMVEPDIIDEAETLATISDGQFDYLIAAHVLEHVEDPIAALKAWLRVVRPGGHLLIAVPDMRFSGEQHRPLTSVDHFLRYHEEGPAVSAEEHYREFGSSMQRLSGADLDDYVAKAEPMIHFHTFTLASFLDLLIAVQHLGFEILEACVNVNEDIVVLRRN